MARPDGSAIHFGYATGMIAMCPQAPDWWIRAYSVIAYFTSCNGGGSFGGAKTSSCCVAVLDPRYPLAHELRLAAKAAKMQMRLNFFIIRL